MTDRTTWIQADLTCLLCGRRVGSLVGWAASDRSLPVARQFFAFKSAGTAARVERLRGRDQLRCSDCGGYGVVDEVELLAPHPRAGRTTRPSLPTRWQAAQRQRRLRKRHLYSRIGA